MHAAVVERRAFGVMAFQRHVARCHVTDAKHRQIANLALGDEALNILVIPGIAVEQIHGDQTVG